MRRLPGITRNKISAVPTFYRHNFSLKKLVPSFSFHISFNGGCNYFYGHKLKKEGGGGLVVLSVNRHYLSTGL